MLTFLPLIGPILTPVINLFGKYFDDKTQVVKTETEGSVAVIKATEEDWGVRLARDIVIWPWAAWYGLMGWDTLIAKIHPSWMLTVPPPPSGFEYVPYAVMVFLLGNIGLNMWKRNG